MVAADARMATPGSAEDLHRAWPDLIRLPAGGGAEIVYVLPERTAHVVGPERLRVLLACQGFATLDQHAARIAAEGGGGATAVRAELGELSRAGLLVSAGALLRRLEDAGPPEATARVAALGIPTRDRVPELRAALESYVDNALAHERQLEYVVADGAEDAATRAETRAAIAEIGARRGVPVAYLGPRRRRATPPSSPTTPACRAPSSSSPSSTRRAAGTRWAATRTRSSSTAPASR